MSEEAATLWGNYLFSYARIIVVTPHPKLRLLISLQLYHIYYFNKSVSTVIHSCP